jgi:Superinfection immunity protein
MTTESDIRNFLGAALAAIVFIGAMMVATPLLGANAFIIIFVILGLAVYFLPTVVAGGRGHHNAGAILILNLFVGWTFLGWVGALVWAFTMVKRQVVDTTSLAT